MQLDNDGLHDLNIQAEWQKKNGTYWVRYIHVELVGFPAAAAAAAGKSQRTCRPDTSP